MQEISKHNQSPQGDRARSIYRDLSAGNSSQSNRLIEAAKNTGIIIPNGTRFSKYIKIADNRQTEREFRARARLEIYQLATALENIGNIPEWKDVIKDAIKRDPEIPNSTSLSKGRDSLFEIYVAGRFSAAGAKVHPGEPDILVEIDDANFCIAAKRIKSPKQIIKNIRDARDQITRRSMDGFIALDLSPLQESYYKPIITADRGNFFSRPELFLNSYFETLREKITAACKANHILGVIAFAHICAVEGNAEGTQLMAATVNAMNFEKKDPSKYPYAISIVNKLSRPRKMG